MSTVDELPWHAQAWYKRYFNARLCHTRKMVSPENMVFVEATLVDQPHKLALDASCPFPVVALDTHSVTI